MEEAEQQANPIPYEELAAQAKSDARTSFYVLVFACDGSAGPPGHSFEAWRQLCSRYGTSNSSMHLRQAVLGISFGTSLDHSKERLREFGCCVANSRESPFQRCTRRNQNRNLM
jgi:hypothetical protein